MTDTTPGPWMIMPYIQPLSSRGWIIRSQTEDLSAVACVLGTKWDSEGESLGWRNARLIAAAPELLEACEMVLSADGDLYAIDFQQIRDAVNKATGE